MTGNSVSLRLNARTGLTFDKDGVFVPFHQLASVRSFKLKAANEDLNTIEQAMKDIMNEIDIITTMSNKLPQASAIYKIKIASLKEEFNTLYTTFNKYKKIKDSL